MASLLAAGDVPPRHHGLVHRRGARRDAGRRRKRAGLDTAWQVGTLGVAHRRRPRRAADQRRTPAGSPGVGVERSGRRMHLFARTQLASERLRADRPLRARAAAEAAQLRRRRHRPRSVSAACSSPTATRATGSRSSVETVGASYSLTLGSYGFVSLFANHTRSQDSQTDVYLGWTMPLGNRRSVGSSLSYRPDLATGDSLEATATLQQNLPAGSGTGYYLSASSTEDVQASLSYQGRAGQAGVEYSRRDDIDGWRATALGGLTLTVGRRAADALAGPELCRGPGGRLPRSDRVRREPADRPHRPQGPCAARSPPPLRHEPGEPGPGRAAAGCLAFESDRALSRPPTAAGPSSDSRSRARPRQRCGWCRKAVSPCRQAPSSCAGRGGHRRTRWVDLPHRRCGLQRSFRKLAGAPLSFLLPATRGRRPDAGPRRGSVPCDRRRERPEGSGRRNRQPDAASGSGQPASPGAASSRRRSRNSLTFADACCRTVISDSTERNRCTKSVDVDVIRESGERRDVEQVPGRPGRVHTVVDVELLVALLEVRARQHDGCRFIDRFDPRASHDLRRYTEACVAHAGEDRCCRQRSSQDQSKSRKAVDF